MNILGIDIGGTKTIVGVSNESGELFAHKRIETPNSLGYKANMDNIIASARDVIQESGVCIDAVGVGCGGPMDRETGVLHQVPNLPGWEGISLKKVFGEAFGVPVYVDNDATAAALGELMFGAGKGVTDFVYFTISTGIGGGIIMNGKVYRGYGENAGEFGHMKVRPDGPLCTCGDHGCLESLASGTSIARIAQERLSDSTNTIIKSWINSEDDISAAIVARAAAQGDGFAGNIWNEATYDLGIGIANVVNCLNPRLVIIGGGVAKAGNILFEPVRRIVSERAMKPLAKDVEIVPAANGDLVGLMGAAAVALDGINAITQNQDNKGVDYERK